MYLIHITNTREEKYLINYQSSHPKFIKLLIVEFKLLLLYKLYILISIQS